MAELGHRLQREHLRVHLALDVEHDAQEPARRGADADRRDVRIAAAARAPRACASSGVASTRARSSTTRSGCFSSTSWYSIGAADSRMRRVYSCAGHRRADAICNAAPCATPADSGIAGTTSHDSARRRSSETPVSPVRSGAETRRIASTHRLPRSVCAHARQRSPGALRRERQRQRDIRGRQQRRDALRPFDQAYRVVAKAFGKARCFPFLGIGEPIKINVIEVYARKRDNVQPARTSGSSPRLRIPSARNSPRTSVVLPAPRSPDSVTTMPPSSARRERGACTRRSRRHREGERSMSRDGSFARLRYASAHERIVRHAAARRIGARLGRARARHRALGPRARLPARSASPDIDLGGRGSALA